MIDTYHGNARRKPNTKEYENNYDKINWENNNWAEPKERKKYAKSKKSSQKSSEKT